MAKATADGLAKTKLAAAVNGGVYLAASAIEAGPGLLSQKLDRAEGRSDDQRQHHRILNGSWSVFAPQETEQSLHDAPPFQAKDY
jgi:hypothetical protein